MTKQLVISASSCMPGRPDPGQGAVTADTPAKEEAPPRTAAQQDRPGHRLSQQRPGHPRGRRARRPGHLELVVTPLPPHTVNSSLYTEGTDGIRVLTTRFRTRPVKEDTREEVRKLEDEIKKLQLDASRSSRPTSRPSSRTWPCSASWRTSPPPARTHATEKGKLNSDATIALAKYVMEGRGREDQGAGRRCSSSCRTTRSRSSSSPRKLQRADGRLQQDRARRRHRRGQGQRRPPARCGSTTWSTRPRGGRSTSSAPARTPRTPVQVEYLAAIMQQTGEDWQGVNLMLSTAQPMLNAAPPDLKMLAVTVVPTAPRRPTPAADARPGRQPGRPGRPAGRRPGGQLGRPAGRAAAVRQPGRQHRPRT